KIRGDEQYIDSSDQDGDDSRDELDSKVVSGVGLPARRKSKKGLISTILELLPDCEQRARMVQPGSFSQPSQNVSSSQQSTSICNDTSVIKRAQQPGTTGERVVTPTILKSATPTNINMVISIAE
ncbi:hypothetical protein HAX54_051069, partial [Datura stramonium]|nr:hypothetical protein [Datura stramonium]